MKWKYFKFVHGGVTSHAKFYRANEKRAEYLTFDEGKAWWALSSFGNVDEVASCTANPYFCGAITIRELPVKGRFAKFNPEVQ